MRVAREQILVKHKKMTRMKFVAFLGCVGALHTPSLAQARAPSRYAARPLRVRGDPDRVTQGGPVMELQPKSTLSLARLLKLSVFGGVTYASLASGASMSKAVGAKVVAWSLVATLPGIFDAHLAVSLGYGLAMLWIGGLFLPLCKGSPSALLALAYMLYGVKVVLFQAARDARPDYVEKALAPARAKQPRPASLMARLPFVMSIGLLLSTFSLPLHTASSVAAVGLPSEWSARAWGVLYASGAALFSLLVQVRTPHDLPTISTRSPPSMAFAAPLLTPGADHRRRPKVQAQGEQRRRLTLLRRPLGDLAPPQLPRRDRLPLRRARRRPERQPQRRERLAISARAGHIHLDHVRVDAQPRAAPARGLRRPARVPSLREGDAAPLRRRRCHGSRHLPMALPGWMDGRVRGAGGGIVLMRAVWFLARLHLWCCCWFDLPSCSNTGYKLTW